MRVKHDAMIKGACKISKDAFDGVPVMNMRIMHELSNFVDRV